MYRIRTASKVYVWVKQKQDIQNICVKHDLEEFSMLGFGLKIISEQSLNYDNQRKSEPLSVVNSQAMITEVFS